MDFVRWRFVTYAVDVQILSGDERVGLSQISGHFAQPIPANVGGTGMNDRDFGLGFCSVLRSLGLSS